jgi:Mce-associated membrane protein
LDFNKAQEDVNRILDNSTGEFRDDFKNQAAIFAKEAQDSRVVAEVTVDFAAVESMTKDSATVLVAATSRVTNVTGAKQEPRSWRLSVNLLSDGGRVKMAKVEFVT